MCKTRTMGYIKLHRSIREWGWYDDPNTLSLWIHLLVEANWKDGEWHGEALRRGQMITSVAKLAASTNLSNKQIRTCLERLENGGEIVKEGANKWTKITICKYDAYQCDDDAEGQTNGKQTASKGQTNGKQRATIEEGKKEITEEIKKTSNDVKENKIADFSQDVEELYAIYPTKCPKSGRGTDKGRESKKILVRLLKNHSRQEIESAIRSYLDDCNKTNTFIKNFDSLLHRIERGDISDNLFESQQTVSTDWLVEGKLYYEPAFVGHEDVLKNLDFELIRHLKRNRGALIWKNGKFIIA